LPIDANIEAYDERLEPGPSAKLCDRLESRLAELQGRSCLSQEQLEFGALVRIRAEARAVPDGSRAQKKTLREVTKDCTAHPRRSSRP
jgi:hypothetical protein